MAPEELKRAADYSDDERRSDEEKNKEIDRGPSWARMTRTGLLGDDAKIGETAGRSARARGRCASARPGPGRLEARKKLQQIAKERGGLTIKQLQQALARRRLAAPRAGRDLGRRTRPRPSRRSRPPAGWARATRDGCQGTIKPEPASSSRPEPRPTRWWPGKLTMAGPEITGNDDDMGGVHQLPGSTGTHGVDPHAGTVEAGSWPNSSTTSRASSSCSTRATAGDNPFRADHRRLSADRLAERRHRHRAGHPAARQLPVPAHAQGPGLRLQLRRADRPDPGQRHGLREDVQRHRRACRRCWSTTRPTGSRSGLTRSRSSSAPARPAGSAASSPS